MYVYVFRDICIGIWVEDFEKSRAARDPLHMCRLPRVSGVLSGGF